MITQAVCRVLVGREDELSTLEDALLAATRGAGSVLVLAGDAGVGKSRLCSELRQRADRIGVAVMEGSCSEADLALPYLPFLEAIGNHIALADINELRNRLGVHAVELARVFPQLAEEAASGPDQSDARLRLFEAVLALLRIASEERGLLLIVEDLHWADASTRELLDYMTRRLRSTRILVVATYRRDEMHRKHPLLPTLQGWQRSRLAQLVELDPLGPDNVARMVSAIFDDTTVGGEFRDFMHERSEGNPFVIEEMLKAAIDRGDVYLEDSDWVRKPIAQMRIPETVRDTILLRVERLETDQAEILRCAAVLGRSFDYRTLIGVAGRDRSAVEAALQTAVQQQLLEEEPGKDGGYRFRHALTQEAVYDDLSAPARERLHSAAADTIAAGPDSATAQVAYHLRAANRREEAVTATLAAAAEAEQQYGFGEAAALYTLLLPSVTSGIERGRLLCRLGEAYYWAALPGPAIEPLEEGIRILEGEGEMAEAARHRLTLGRTHWERNHQARAREEYEAALRVLEPLGPSRELALAYVRLAGLHVFDADAEGAQRFAERAIAVAEAAGADDMRIWAYNFLGASLAYQGDYAGGKAALERSAREGEERGLHDIMGNALHNLISSSTENLDLERLPEIARRLQTNRLERWSVLSALYAGLVYSHLTGEIAKFLEVSLELHERAQQLGNEYFADLAGFGLAHAYLELDQLDDARRWVKAPDLDQNVQSVAGRAWTWLRFHLAAGELATAVAGADAVLRNADRAWLFQDGTSAAMEALVEVGRFEDGERLLGALEKSAAARITPYTISVIRARLALARSAPGPARAALVDAIAGYDSAGLVLLAARARLLLADVDVQLDEPDSAVSLLRQVLATSSAKGMLHLARLAREGLQRLGIAVDAPEVTGVAEAAPDGVGERLVTVMFADVRGYTAMTAETPPAVMVDRISAYQRWAAQEVERHHGVVDKFAGDAVMATFNVSGTQVDHAEHALAAALALRDKAALLGLPVGIGIATGAAVVGRLKDGANLSVVGEATNLAARLQGQAAAGQVLLSEEARRRLRRHADLKPEVLELKGFERPVTAYRLPAAGHFVPN